MEIKQVLDLSYNEATKMHEIDEMLNALQNELEFTDILYVPNTGEVIKISELSRVRGILNAFTYKHLEIQKGNPN